MTTRFQYDRLYAYGSRIRRPPEWRRTTERERALLVLHDALTDERACHQPGTAVHEALGRAQRAVYSAIRATRGEPL